MRTGWDVKKSIFFNRKRSQFLERCEVANDPFYLKYRATYRGPKESGFTGGCQRQFGDGIHGGGPTCQSGARPRQAVSRFGTADALFANHEMEQMIASPSQYG